MRHGVCHTCGAQCQRGEDAIGCSNERHSLANGAPACTKQICRDVRCGLALPPSLPPSLSVCLSALISLFAQRYLIEGIGSTPCNQPSKARSVTDQVCV
jgi:hypothetical protein